MWHARCQHCPCRLPLGLQRLVHCLLGVRQDIRDAWPLGGPNGLGLRRRLLPSRVHDRRISGVVRPDVPQSMSSSRPSLHQPFPQLPSPVASRSRCFLRRSLQATFFVSQPTVTNGTPSAEAPCRHPCRWWGAGYSALASMTVDSG